MIGHRGNSMFAPESTSESNRQSARIGADYFEVDVRLTKDGHAVLTHDDSLSRTTGASGTIAGKTLAELQALDASYAAKFGNKFAGEKIPTLIETSLLAKAESSGVVLDLKVNNAGAAIKQAMAATGFDPSRAIAFGWNDASVADLTGNLPDTSIFHIGFPRGRSAGRQSPLACPGRPEWGREPCTSSTPSSIRATIRRPSWCAGA